MNLLKDESKILEKLFLLYYCISEGVVGPLRNRTQALTCLPARPLAKPLRQIFLRYATYYTRNKAKEIMFTPFIQKGKKNSG